MPFNIQGPELILILIIALIVIGPGKLPDVGSALGKSIREFRKAASDVKETTRLDAAPASSSAATSSAAAATPAQPAPAAIAAPSAASPVTVAPPPAEEPAPAPATPGAPAAPAADPALDRGA